MKGVLFILAICSFVGVGNATCNGFYCAALCNGEGCAQNCDGIGCALRCIGNSCGKDCKQNFCAKTCVGKDCAKNCTGDLCDDGCFHFEGETCTDNEATDTYTMGSPCTNQYLEGTACLMKNHPALWQALEETENTTTGDAITLPSGYIEQCYTDETRKCTKTIDNLPPLLCNHFMDCVLISNGNINENAKCTETHQCGVCQGMCENDSECKGALTCFLRNGTEIVPGCSSSFSTFANAPGKGYCADIPDSSSLNDGDIAAIVIGALVLSAAVGALVWWCKKTKQGFFGSSSSTAEPIKY